MYDPKNMEKTGDPTIRIDQKTYSRLSFSSLGIFDVSNILAPKSINIEQCSIKTPEGKPLTSVLIKEMIDELNMGKTKIGTLSRRLTRIQKRFQKREITLQQKFELEMYDP